MASDDIDTTVRCFRRLKEEPLKTGDRRGIWLMTGERRGAFFHGDRHEVQPPHYDLSDLEQMAGPPFNIQEISPSDALRELAGWPEAQRDAKRIFARHSRCDSYGN